MSKQKSALEAGDQLFKAKDYRGALLKYERALTTSLSTEEQVHGLIQSGLCHHVLREVSDVKPALDSLQQAIALAHTVPALSWMILNASIHGFKICEPLLCSGRPSVCCAAVEFLIYCHAAIDVCAPLLHLKWVPWRVTICKAICHGYEVLGYMAQAETFVTQFMGKVEKLISLLEQAGHPTPASMEPSLNAVKMLLFKYAVYSPSHADERQKPVRLSASPSRSKSNLLANVTKKQALAQTPSSIEKAVDKKALEAASKKYPAFSYHLYPFPFSFPYSFLNLVFPIIYLIFLKSPTKTKPGAPAVKTSTQEFILRELITRFGDTETQLGNAPAIASEIARVSTASLLSNPNSISNNTTISPSVPVPISATLASASSVTLLSDGMISNSVSFSTNQPFSPSASYQFPGKTKTVQNCAVMSVHLAAIIEALTDPTRRPMRQTLSSERQEILEALISIATDLITQEGACNVPTGQLMRLFRQLFSYQRWAPFQTLSEELSFRFGKTMAENNGTFVDAIDFANTKEVEILVAVSRLQIYTQESQGDVPSLMLKLGSLLADCGKDPYLQLCDTQPELVSDAALLLWNWIIHEPDGTPCVVDLLRGVWTILERVKLSDTLITVEAGLRLVEKLESCTLYAEAVGIVRRVLRVIRDVRGEQVQQSLANLTLLESSSNKGEELHDNLAKTTYKALECCVRPSGSGVPAALACLHADAVSSLFRIELKLGLVKEQISAQTKFEQTLADFDTRDKQQNIYGVKTMKQKRIEEDFRSSGPDIPVLSSKTENRLLQEVGANPYEKALLLMQIATYRTDKNQQTTLLKEAESCLLRASATESSLIEMLSLSSPLSLALSVVPPKTSAGAMVPSAPLFVARTEDLIVLRAHPAFARARLEVKTHTLYGKSFGAGTTVSTFNTEYQGTGVPQSLENGDVFTVSGLQTNTSYVFAVGAGDSAGKMVGTIGLTSLELVPLYPLPILQCWSLLALTANSLGSILFFSSFFSFFLDTLYLY